MMKQMQAIYFVVTDIVQAVSFHIFVQSSPKS